MKTPYILALAVILAGCAYDKHHSTPTVTASVTGHIEQATNNLSSVDGKDAVIAEWYRAHNKAN